jgi:hypothetical protein
MDNNGMIISDFIPPKDATYLFKTGQGASIICYLKESSKLPVEIRTIEIKIKDEKTGKWTDLFKDDYETRKKNSNRGRPSANKWSGY